MKKVLILHGYGETPNHFWYPWLKEQLEKKGYQVSIPQLPNTDNPELDKQLEFVNKNCQIDQETILVGHSSGASLILALLESSKVTVKKSILVAGYYKALPVGAQDTKNIREKYDWDKIKSRSKKFVFINSTNDPWGANDQQGRGMHNHLGGMLIVNQEGHMGSEKFNQPFKEFPVLLSLIS